jgi:hypothetical protein
LKCRQFISQIFDSFIRVDSWAKFQISVAGISLDSAGFGLSRRSKAKAEPWLFSPKARSLKPAFCLPPLAAYVKELRMA